LKTQEGEILLRGRGIFQEVGGSSGGSGSAPRDPSESEESEESEESPRDLGGVKCSFADGGRGYWDAEDIALSG
jgi:hypothetical protein